MTTDFRPARLASIFDKLVIVPKIGVYTNVGELTVDITSISQEDIEFYDSIKDDKHIFVASKVLSRQSYLQLDTAYISAKKVRDFIALHQPEYETEFHLWQAAIESVSGQNIYEVAKLIYPND